MVKEICVATIQVAIDEKNPTKAADLLSEIMGPLCHEGIPDWGYLRVGGQYMYPTTRVVEVDEETGITEIL